MAMLDLYTKNGKNFTPKRYLSIGFDDFRRSDFSLIFPLFNRYGATATYNRIAYGSRLSQSDVALLDILTQTGNEIGDHTWFHCNFIYNDPLFNGQNPNCPEGNQKIFPSNEQLRNNRGDGKNIFGFNLNDSVQKNLSNWHLYNHVWTFFDESWGNLSDEQCQIIREHFSIYKDKSGMLDIFDELSNRYLGTSGKSAGSWSNKENCYAGGIFSGCKTSCNHEIWERVLILTKLFYKNQYDKNFDFKTWSWPGSIPSPFVFEHEDKKYYDENHTILYNYSAKFPSSTITVGGGYWLRSWNQVLRSIGYKISHDTLYPSRNDGMPLPIMSKQFIYNAGFSRLDALLYSTNRSVSYSKVANDYPQEFFSNDKGKSLAAQMYDDGGTFYNFIETIRHNTSNGIIHGEVIDSVDSFSERCFLTQMLEYCRKTGVEVISKEKAFDVCFKQPNFTGNLIYNPTFRNTAKEFMSDAEKISNNPDGYRGDCSVINQSSDNPILSVKGEANYLHCGIPIGKLIYSANIRGQGRIFIYAIKNSDSVALKNSDLELLSSCSINEQSFANKQIEFFVPNNPITDYEQVCEGLGNKIMGIKIVYFGHMEIKGIFLGVAN